MTVFFCSGLDLEHTARELEKLFGVTLERVEARGRTRFEHRGLGHELFFYGDHGHPDGLGIPFSFYDYVIDIVVSVPEGDPHVAADLKEALGVYCCTRLRRARGWRSVLVHDFQRVVMAEEPDPS